MSSGIVLDCVPDSVPRLNESVNCNTKVTTNASIPSKEANQGNDLHAVDEQKAAP